MNIHQIRRATQATNPHFFDRDTLQFFGQTMRSFKIKTVSGRVFIYAPSYWDGKLMGITIREFIGDELLQIRNAGGVVRFCNLREVEEFFRSIG